MFIEQILTARIGDVGKMLHTARSRNDQVALDMRMYVKKEIKNVVSKIKALIEALNFQAEESASIFLRRLSARLSTHTAPAPPKKANCPGKVFRTDFAQRVCPMANSGRAPA